MTPGGVLGFDQVLHGESGFGRVAEKKLDPTGSVNEFHFGASHFASSRMIFKSSWVMKFGIEPCNRSAKASSRFRLLNLRTAVRMASRLVFAPVCLMTSLRSSSGISIVVFMLPNYYFMKSSQCLF